MVRAGAEDQRGLVHRGGRGKGRGDQAGNNNGEKILIDSNSGGSRLEAPAIVAVASQTGASSIP